MWQYMMDANKLDWLLDNQHMIQLPIVRNGKQATIGYQPDVWEEMGIMAQMKICAFYMDIFCHDMIDG